MIPRIRIELLDRRVVSLQLFVDQLRLFEPSQKPFVEPFFFRMLFDFAPEEGDGFCFLFIRGKRRNVTLEHAAVSYPTLVLGFDRSCVDIGRLGIGLTVFALVIAIAAGGFGFGCIVGIAVGFNAVANLVDQVLDGRRDSVAPMLGRYRHERDTLRMIASRSIQQLRQHRSFARSIFQCDVRIGDPERDLGVSSRVGIALLKLTACFNGQLVFRQ